MSAMCASLSGFWCCCDTNCQILYLQDKDNSFARLIWTRLAQFLEFEPCQAFISSCAVTHCFVNSMAIRLLQKATITSFPSSSRDGGFSTTTDCVAARCAVPDGCADMPPLLVAEELRHNTPGQHIDRQPRCCTLRRCASDLSLGSLCSPLAEGRMASLLYCDTPLWLLRRVDH